MIIAWLVCLILTATDVFPNDPNKWGYAARTDVKINVLREAKWFRVPYPGKYKIFFLKSLFSPTSMWRKRESCRVGLCKTVSKLTCHKNSRKINPKPL